MPRHTVRGRTSLGMCCLLILRSVGFIVSSNFQMDGVEESFRIRFTSVRLYAYRIGDLREPPRQMFWTAA
jgi:hypothetical protein